MKRNWIVRLILLAGLVILISWIASRTYWDEIRIPTPLKGDAATNPFYSMQDLAEGLGADAERRHILGTPPSSDAVIVLSSWHWSLIETRRQQLEDWVAAGGRLVVDHTLISAEDEFRRWSGIARAHPRPDDEQAQEAAEADYNDTNKCIWLKVAPVVSARDSYHVCNVAGGSWLTSERTGSWTLHDEKLLQAVRVDIGRGSVTMLNAAAFGNRELLDSDHALLFVAATQLRHGDEIVFLSEEEQASLLSLIWTHGAPAVVLALILLAVALWRGAVRFGPLTASPDAARRSIAEQIRGTGQFALRFGGGRSLHAAMVRALHEAAERRIAGYAGLPAEAQVAAIARIVPVDAERLAETINYNGARHAGELRNAVTMLEYTRRRLLNAQDDKGVTNAS